MILMEEAESVTNFKTLIKLERRKKKNIGGEVVLVVQRFYSSIFSCIKVKHPLCGLNISYKLKLAQSVQLHYI